eukprot:TRINITY_DN6588_c0_g1_i1.p1 TRINITY_DN6588_c0_g1~~TRINITY_DN6588_c0_g1_i1.p1  ORF type:complete len:227 (+),score=24.69 TRINITY_DN6588_c0_g1_i1:21-701(+)
MSMSSSEYSREVLKWTESLREHQLSNWKTQMEQWHGLALGFLNNMSKSSSKEATPHRTTQSSRISSGGSAARPPRGDYKIPPPWKRFIAGLIDLFISEIIQTGIAFACERYDVLNVNIWVLSIVDYTVDCLFYVIFSTGAFGLYSPGKRLLKLQILSCNEQVSFLSPSQVRIRPGVSIPFQTALTRWFFRCLYWFFPFFLIIEFPNNLSMHDYFSSSIVVESQPST